MLFAALALVSAGAGDHLPTQSSPYAKLIGTWVMDSTNGVDDKGLPSSEKLVFSVTRSTLRISATTDEGHGPWTSAFDCHDGSGAITDVGNGQSTKCVTRPTPDSVMYSLDMIDNGKTVPAEHGRLVVQPNGLLRDQYDELSESGPATHHRHIYHKVP
jgi:hypothetical protein